MLVQFFSTLPFEQPLFEALKPQGTDFAFFSHRLTESSVQSMASCKVISVFINDDCGATVIPQLAKKGVKLILTRSAGFDHINLNLCQDLGISVARVPEYSPFSIAEHSVMLLLALNRRLPLALKNQEHNDFRVDELMGFDIQGKKIGVVGAGTIGCKFLAIMKGFGTQTYYYDINPSQEAETLGATYLGFQELVSTCDIVSLHCPLNEKTRYLMDEKALLSMKPNSILINTGRGALVETMALLRVLNTKQSLSFYGADVYEKEKGQFFFNHSDDGLQDEVLQQLLNHPQVLITCHQAYLTQEAVKNIVDSTIANLIAFRNGSTNAAFLTSQNKNPLRL